MSARLKVLHVGAEAHPLVKTGGLADVMGALPAALAAAGDDVRLLLPGLPAVLDAMRAHKVIADAGPAFGALRVRLLRGRMPGSGLPLYAIDAPTLYRRGGGPYQDASGQPWHDNLQRFALLGWVAAHLAGGDGDVQWQPDVVHAHDWHAALSCAYLQGPAMLRAASVFTVHNLAFQGLYPASDFNLLGLPARWFAPDGLEFHGQLNVLKAGLKLADRITTVSPTYAREITTPAHGFGLDGVLRARGSDVTGIVNGIDDQLWNPATDADLPARYDAGRLDGKQRCREALLAECGWVGRTDGFIATAVSRLTDQKGLDLLIGALPALIGRGMRVVIQGTGESALEQAWLSAQHVHPDHVRVYIGYDEARAHRMIAGADAIVVPSRFEPCGLTQLYGLRYGTLPVVRHVGGLVDTVHDNEHDGNGFAFGPPVPGALADALLRAEAMWREAPDAWRARQQHAMRAPLGWAAPARAYRALYEQALAQRRGG